MTVRKPGEDRIDDFVERQIREAMRSGEFDDLKGKGQPLTDLDDDDPMWWVKRKMREEGLAMPLPPALELKAAVAARLTSLLRLKSEREVRAAVAELNDRIAKFNRTNIDGPPSDLGALDADLVLERWRAR